MWDKPNKELEEVYADDLCHVNPLFYGKNQSFLIDLFWTADSKYTIQQANRGE